MIEELKQIQNNVLCDNKEVKIKQNTLRNDYKDGGLMSVDIRGGSRTVATSNVELFVIIVNGFQPLTIITKNSTLDVAAVLDPPLDIKHKIASLKCSWVKRLYTENFQEWKIIPS